MLLDYYSLYADSYLCLCLVGWACFFWLYLIVCWFKADWFTLDRICCGFLLFVGFRFG